ncbi:MAG: hypothetical protein KDB14_34045 [Planctomycetales bacterium]|nr:hypothetical protein [Planctomycetales bacterium]
MRCPLLALTAWAAFCLTATACGQTGPTSGDREGEPVHRLEEALQAILSHASSAPNRRLLEDAAIKAMLRALDDPHASYHPQGGNQGAALAPAPSIPSALEGWGRNAQGDWQHLLTLDSGKRAAYLRLTAFSSGVGDAFRQQLRMARQQRATCLCLDLRDNAGGLVDEAVAVCDTLLDAGLIVTAVTCDAQPHAWRATPNSRTDVEFASWPVVVLANRFSASASEIVAACLQDHGRAELVGERTWGKATVQRFLELPSGGNLQLTVGKYQRPSGEPIDRVGVEPTLNNSLALTQDELKTLMRHRRDHLSNASSQKLLRVDRQLSLALARLNATLVEGNPKHQRGIESPSPPAVKGKLKRQRGIASPSPPATPPSTGSNR